MNTKIILQDLCRKKLEATIELARTAMRDAQDSANREEKSSMGDKYETGRAMSHQERDMHARQLNHLQMELAKLLRIDCGVHHNRAELGALVETKDNTYWIAVALGQVKMKQGTVMVVSPDSPVAKAMVGNQAGDFFLLRDKETKIETVS